MCVSPLGATEFFFFFFAPGWILVDEAVDSIGGQSYGLRLVVISVYTRIDPVGSTARGSKRGEIGEEKVGGKAEDRGNGAIRRSTYLSWMPEQIDLCAQAGKTGFPLHILNLPNLRRDIRQGLVKSIGEKSKWRMAWLGDWEEDSEIRRSVSFLPPSARHLLGLGRRGGRRTCTYIYTGYSPAQHCSSPKNS